MKKQNKLRYISDSIDEAIDRRMIFIGGPRQVGKTTLSLNYLSPPTPQNPQYLNWDRVSDKSAILKDQIPLRSKTLVLDEIHKYKKWRNLVKGLFDKYHNNHRFIVTGSARLDHLRRGGDSLVGRYRYYRLHPFSLNELNKNPTKSDLENLMKFGGFPEPLFLQSEKELRIWQKERMHRVVSEDLRDIENVKEVSLLLLLAEILPSKVGSPLSLKSLAEDLEVSQPTVDRWIQILSTLYYCFLIPPFGSPKIRAVKKLNKLYLWDWSVIDESGYRFENLVSSHLLKYCHYIEDTQGHTMELRYLRDTDEREIDFVVLKNKKPLFAVECKSGEKCLSKHIHYFKERTKIPAFYQVHQQTKDYGDPITGRVLPFTTFCSEIGLV
jgi:predicted AAA+ superfamily ATPase